MGCQALDATSMVSIRHVGSSGEGALAGAGQGSWRGEQNRRSPSQRTLPPGAFSPPLCDCGKSTAGHQR